MEPPRPRRPWGPGHDDAWTQAMRQILIDELSKNEVARVGEYLSRRAQPSGVEGLYWLPLAEDQLEEAQAACAADHPFCLAVELGESWVKFELLVRSRININSPGAAYATPRQLAQIIGLAYAMVEELGLGT